MNSFLLSSISSAVPQVVWTLASDWPVQAAIDSTSKSQVLPKVCDGQGGRSSQHWSQFSWIFTGSSKQSVIFFSQTYWSCTKKTCLGPIKNGEAGKNWCQAANLVTGKPCWSSIHRCQVKSKVNVGPPLRSEVQCAEELYINKYNLCIMINNDV